MGPTTVNSVDALGGRFVDWVRLGDGAEGGAFAARERGTGVRVVLKAVLPEAARTVRLAFARLRRVASPHLPAPRELVAEPDGTTWLVTDWVEGEALGPGPVPPATAVADALALAHALAAIHRAGTHHGDVSLGNLVRTPTRGVVLVDLAQLGRRGTGTPGFLAPEVLQGGGGPAADRFALGCVLLARLTGELPWRRPELLARLHADEVRRRLAELVHAVAIPRVLVALLERLLDPSPLSRLGDDDAIVQRLAQIQAALRDGVDLRPPTTWWLPSRWTWRGVDPRPIARRLVDADRPRLVAVAGPPHAGRTRFVEELVQLLQESGDAARLVDAEALAALGRQPGAPWLEAWVDASAGIFGLRGAVVHGAGVRAQAATLRTAAALAEATVVLAVEPELGEVLAQAGDPRVHVVAMRPWTADELAAALHDALESDEPARWCAAVHAATGGWSGRVVRTLGALASAGVETPSAAAIEAAVGRQGGDAALDEGLARAALLAVWIDDGTSGLPAHLHDGHRPRTTVVADARRRLGTELPTFATEVLAERRASGGPIGLRLALDAGDEQAIADAIAQRRDLRPGMPEVAAFTAWLQCARAGAGELRAVGARLLLAEGAPAEALAVAERGNATPACVLEAARALQRLGRGDDALARLAPLLHAADPDLRLRACGLHVRLLVDRGRSHDARGWIAEHVPTAADGTGIGWGTLRLWSGFAALASGDRSLAERELQAAVAAVAGLDDIAAHGVRARVIQLLGNLAHERGERIAAARAWAEAASAFERAGEPVGGLGLHGSLAGLALLGYDLATGIGHGRAAVRGLLARGQIDALVPAALHLVQLWVRVGAREQAEALGRRVGELVEQAAAPTRARAQRLDAELQWASVAEQTSGDPSPAQWLAARTAFDHAGRALVRAELWREAAEAHLRACACARLAGRLDVATADLAAGRGAATKAGDDDALPVRLEELALAAARHDTDAVQRRLAELEPLVDLPGWIRRGELERAWQVARALWSVAATRMPTGHRARARALDSLLSISEAIMDKTPSIDRPAVRAGMWADAERDALRELARELGPDPAPAIATTPAASTAVAGEPRPASPAAPATGERLLRIYRRLAREDRLEPLLEQVVDAVMDLTDAERGAIVVQAGTGDRIEVIREIGREGEGVQFSRSIIDRVLGSGEPVLSVDAAADDRFDGSRSISHLNLRSVLAVPLRFRGEVLGAVYVDHRLRRGNFDERDLDRVEAFAELAALAVAHARALTEVRAQAARIAEQHARLRDLLEAREAEVQGLRARVEQVGDAGTRHGIVGKSAAMQRVFKLVDRLAETDVPVLVQGESGTGKELVARAIHEGGHRRKGPFVAENCGAIPETLLESVLFGHARGAFTGADKAKPGLFEAAHGGTIFLDEVGETSPAMQTKLLRVLQEGEVRRIGENTSRPVDVRVVAASNRDLEAMVRAGTFRQDLFYRIHVVKLELPPLRERPEDIPALVQFFAARHGASGLEVGAAAMRALASHAWPGNVRELENEVLRWVALCDGTVQPDDLSPPVRGTTRGVDPDDLRIRPRVDRLERDLIARAMTRAGGNQTRAAELLGLSRFGLQKKLRKLDGGPGGGEPERDE